MNLQEKIRDMEPISWSADNDHRKTFAQYPTGVTVVTTRDAFGAPVGMTVNSFTSVSLDPPLVSWSLRTSSQSRETFRTAKYFAINILSKEQTHLSQLFCSPDQNKFAEIPYIEGVKGTPLLSGCAAVIECQRQDFVTWGDHDVICGRVLRHAYHDREPLAFLGGVYGGFSARLNDA